MIDEEFKEDMAHVGEVLSENILTEEKYRDVGNRISNPKKIVNNSEEVPPHIAINVKDLEEKYKSFVPFEDFWEDVRRETHEFEIVHEDVNFAILYTVNQLGPITISELEDQTRNESIEIGERLSSLESIGVVTRNEAENLEYEITSKGREYLGD